MGIWEMKTTVELPDTLFREAKAHAARQGVSLKEFFTAAIQNQLRRSTQRALPAGPAWKQAFGGLRDLHRETRRIERAIAAEFERIDEEEWR